MLKLVSSQVVRKDNKYVVQKYIGKTKKQKSEYNQEMPQSHTTDQPLSTVRKRHRTFTATREQKYNEVKQPGLEVIKLFLILNSTEHKIYHPHNIKMPTIVGILTFISMINTTSKSLKARKGFIFQHLSFYEHLKFHTQLS